MKNRQATEHVINFAADDIEHNQDIVAPLINYACKNFPDMEERMRFMVLVTFTCAGFTRDVPLNDVIHMVPDAICDMAEAFTEHAEPSGNTVH